MHSLKPFLSLLIVLVGILQACSNNPSYTNKSSSYVQAISPKPDPEFDRFLKKFKPLSLPFTIELFKIKVDSSRKLDSRDNAFIKSQYPNEIYAFGILPDTSDTFKIIWLQPAEVEVPVLTTFTKHGEKIGEDYLGVGQCGSDCCYECKEFIFLNKNLSIFSADSIKSCECDSTGPKKNTTKKYVLYKTGKIQKNGKFQMSKILKKEII